MARDIHPFTENKLVEDLVAKLQFARQFERKSTEYASQYGWYNGYVSALYTIYGSAVAERVSDTATQIFNDALAKEQKEG